MTIDVFPEALAPVHDLGTGAPLASWRWLVGSTARPRLLTAMGDLFLVKPTGLLRRQSVFLLDTSAGSFEHVASSWDAFRELIAAPSEDVADWFKLSLVVALRDAGIVLSMGQCYSAIHPLALGGSIGIDNFEQCSWQLHVGLMGQIHQQLRNVPAGTRVTGISVK